MNQATSIQTINELASELLATRKHINEQETVTDALKLKRDDLQARLLATLQENKLKQWKTEDATISRKESLRYIVLDKKALIANLKETGLGHFVTESLNEMWRGVSSDLAKQGRELAGAKIETKEYISVSLAKPKVEEPIERGWALDANGEAIHD